MMRTALTFLFFAFSKTNLAGGLLYPVEYDDLGKPCSTRHVPNGEYKLISDCEHGNTDAEAFIKFVGPVTCCGAPHISVKSAPRIGERAKKYCEEYGALKPTVLDFHIINGDRSDVAEFPHMAALGLENLDGEVKFECGGALISENFVVTAAHCVNRKDRKPKIVRLGRTSIDLTDPNDTSKVLDVALKGLPIIAPEYSAQSKYDDIALIELSQRVSFAENIAPICLQYDNDDLKEERIFTIIGFGFTDSSQTVSSNWLQKATVRELPLKDCIEMYQTALVNGLRRGIINSQLCARDSQEQETSDACRGDSGSPMQMARLDNKYQMVGLTSFGLGCGSTFPSVYTRVLSRISWIEDHVWPVTP